MLTPDTAAEALIRFQRHAIGGSRSMPGDFAGVTVIRRLGSVPIGSLRLTVHVVNLYAHHVNMAGVVATG